MFFGQVGQAAGSALQMGLQDFVSALTFGLVPLPSMGGMDGMKKDGMGGMMQMPNPQGQTEVAALASAIEAGILTLQKGQMSTLEYLKSILMGGKVSDMPSVGTQYNVDSMGNIIDPSGKIVGKSNTVTVQVEKPAQTDFITRLTDIIRGSPKDVTLSTGSINDIFRSAYQFLQKGSSDITQFLETTKLPTAGGKGISLAELFGFTKGGTEIRVIPEAFGSSDSVGQASMKNLMMMALNIDNKQNTEFQAAQAREAMKAKDLISMNQMLFASTGFAGDIMGEKITGSQFTRTSQQESVAVMAEAARSLMIANRLGYTDPTSYMGMPMSSVYGTKSGYAYYDKRSMMYI